MSFSVLSRQFFLVTLILVPFTIHSQESVKPAKRQIASGEVFRDCAECPEMVVIAAGTFTMGNRSKQEQETPAHTVRIGQAFAMGKTHVTRGQFARFIAETGYAAANTCATIEKSQWEERKNRHWRNPSFAQEDSHPVVCVSWNDAQAYAAWLSQKTGKSYGLPTEAQWEYAARAGTTTNSYWGDNPNLACAYANVTDRTAKQQIPDVIGSWIHECKDGYGYTSPAGTFKANPWGLFDMIGNAWQWVEDCWHKDYTGAPTDGSAWVSGCQEGNGRMIRGGSWYSVPRESRSVTRYWDEPSFPSFYTGFRLTRKLP